MRETWVQFLGGEEPLEKGVATHSSILAWEIPWTEEPDGATVHRSQRDTTELSSYVKILIERSLHNKTDIYIRLSLCPVFFSFYFLEKSSNTRLIQNGISVSIFKLHLVRSGLS